MFTRQVAVRHRRTRLRRAERILALTASLFILAPGTNLAKAAPPARADSVVVMIDHAKVVRLPAKAQTVIVGNPAIADVSVQKNGVMIVTGKSFGVTNLIALDGSGALLAESLVQVGAAADTTLVVQRGMDRESYSCTPACQPSAQLGDEQRYFSQVSGQVNTRNAQAVGAQR